MKTKSRYYLSIVLIAALFVPTWIVYASPLYDVSNFRLRADAGWADSGFTLQAGQQLTITAYGQAITAPLNFYGSGSVSGPDDQLIICPNYVDAPPCAMDNSPYGALVGKIGIDGTPFLIGSSFTFTPSSADELYLAVNDLLPYYEDNNGNYMVFFNH